MKSMQTGSVLKLFGCHFESKMYHTNIYKRSIFCAYKVHIFISNKDDKSITTIKGRVDIQCKALDAIDDKRDPPIRLLIE